MVWIIFALTAMVVCAYLLSSNTPASANYILHWSDEFDGPKGSAPDSTKWNYDLGGSGFGNHELECYTDRRENSYLDGNGNLVMKAIKESFTGADGIKKDYTSARLLTKGKFSHTFGRWEARIKMPTGQGIWPAFWMMGDNIDKVGWPGCRELDIGEIKGSQPSENNGSLHAPGFSGANCLTGKFTLPEGKKFSDDFHIFSIEWLPDCIRFYVDGQLYSTKTPADVPGKEWGYDKPCFILLDLAIGGDFGGNPDDTTVFPQEMLVDYVRVYDVDHDRLGFFRHYLHAPPI